MKIILVILYGLSTDWNGCSMNWSLGVQFIASHFFSQLSGKWLLGSIMLESSLHRTYILSREECRFKYFGVEIKTFFCTNHKILNIELGKHVRLTIWYQSIHIQIHTCLYECILFLWIKINMNVWINICHKSIITTIIIIKKYKYIIIMIYIINGNSIILFIGRIIVWEQMNVRLFIILLYYVIAIILYFCDISML